MVLICAGGKVFRSVLASIWVAQIALTHHKFRLWRVRRSPSARPASPLSLAKPSHDSPGQGWGGSIQLISGGSWGDVTRLMTKIRFAVLSFTLSAGLRLCGQWMRMSKCEASPRGLGKAAGVNPSTATAGARHTPRRLTNQRLAIQGNGAAGRRRGRERQRRRQVG